MSWEMDLADTLKKLRPADVNNGFDQSAVLVPIAFNPQSHTYEILLTKRTMLVESHKGQISFPGGYAESTDSSLLNTATREAQEEIGLHPNSVTILGALNPVQTSFAVTIYPYVGRVDLPYPFLLNGAEVEKMVFLPVSLLREKGLEEMSVNVGGVSVKSLGIWIEDDLIWGATAKILEELRTFLLPLKLEGGSRG